MNKERSLALYQQGRDAWNEWAESMVAERTALEEAGEWVDGSEGVQRNDATRAWYNEARADFASQRFNMNAEFSNYTFRAQ